jgi:hypothetical protein
VPPAGGRSEMNLAFKPFDENEINPKRDVIDKESNRIVGTVQGGYLGIDVSLFGRKYKTLARSQDECLGFISGVQSVLNGMTSVDDGKTTN